MTKKDEFLRNVSDEEVRETYRKINEAKTPKTIDLKESFRFREMGLGAPKAKYVSKAYSD